MQLLVYLFQQSGITPPGCSKIQATGLEHDRGRAQAHDFSLQIPEGMIGCGRIGFTALYRVESQLIAVSVNEDYLCTELQRLPLQVLLLDRALQHSQSLAVQFGY
ncbi:MAG: hypothetical protein WAV92_03015 [Halopseudomonas yangmingensis]